eukprot:448535-Pleurochrysis_carterae.AAC.1
MTLAAQKWARAKRCTLKSHVPRMHARKLPRRSRPKHKCRPLPRLSQSPLTQPSPARARFPLVSGGPARVVASFGQLTAASCAASARGLHTVHCVVS